MSTKHYGKYRGTVINNVDPMQQGRIQVQVPDVLTMTPSNWAMPCVPVAGIQSGVFVLPALGAGVWVEFENGDPSYPIWVGGFWASAAEVPVMAMGGLPTSPNILLQTANQNMFQLSDAPGLGIMLKSMTGAMIMINETGILISNGQGATIALTGNTVAINSGALTVM